jgi:ribonucleotide monophosphatase NagD (HAD superfamily)
VVGAIEGCTGTKCEVNVGKPNPIMLQTIMGVVGLDEKDCIMTGDRLYTEIRMALDAGMPSAVVLTGETTTEELNEESKRTSRTYVLDRIDRLVPPEMWREFGWEDA